MSIISFQWSDDPLSGIHQIKYRAATQRNLKEILYKDIIDYFDKGKVIYKFTYLI